MNSGRNIRQRAKAFDEKVVLDKKRKRKPIIISIITGVLIGSLVGGIMIYHQTRNPYEGMYEDTTDMSDEEVMEYIVDFDDDELAELLTTVSTDEADRVAKLYYVLRISEIEADDEFSETLE